MLEFEAPAEQTRPEPSVPVKMTIGSRAELESGVLMVLGSARRTVRCAAADLSAFPIAGRAAVDVLRAMLLANRNATARLLVDDVAWIESHGARLKLLQREFPHALQIRIADREDAVGGDRVIIADDCHALLMREAQIVHGELWLHHVPYAQPLLMAFDRRWDRAAHNIAVNPLGL
jgi:hypothetical protein